MSRIHVNRNRQNLGQFSPEEIATGLRSGRFFPTDLAWREGMETWQPLSTFTDLPVAEEVPTEPTLAPGSDVAVAAAPGVIMPAWERAGGTWVSRTADTVREVLGSPQQTFAALAETRELIKPLLFLLLVGSVCTAVSMGYQLAFESLAPRASGGQTSPGMIAVIYAGVLVLLPVIITIGSFVSAGIFHLCLLLVGAAPKSFDATYRVVCYANGATSVMLLIPFCGSLIQSVWNLYLLVIGFREAHGTTTGKAVIAVLIPLVTCCGLLLVGAVAIGASIPGLLQGVK